MRRLFRDPTQSIAAAITFAVGALVVPAGAYILTLKGSWDPPN
jgi:hypothetical protein